MKPESRLRSLQLGLLLFTLLAFMLSLMLGPVKTSLAEVIRAILSRPHELSDIILGLRLPELSSPIWSGPAFLFPEPSSRVIFAIPWPTLSSWGLHPELPWEPC